MPLPAPIRFGVFLAPYHSDRVNPTLQIRADLDLVSELDRLGYDEFWVGEHHSGAFEMIASPEVFIAAAAERTRHIRLGTGVVSLPYHHPLMVAERIMQLDHQTQGRVMFGVGPGQLPSDAYMLGIDVARQRDMMVEALEVLIPLLEGEVVTHRSDWFQLNEARLQLLPFTRPRVEVAVAASISPAGPRAAGRFGISMLSMAASSADGFSALPQHWSTCETLAAENGHEVSRANWRLVAPMHIAETREQALADIRHGILDLVSYVERLGGTPQPYGRSVEAAVEQWVERGISVFGTAVIGTPDDAIAAIERFRKQSGGFGTMLLLAHDCASPERTLESYRLIARYVMPAVNGTNAARNASLDWCSERSGQVIGALRGAIQKSIREHEEERARKGEKVAWGDRTDLLVDGKPK